jgi:DNA-binding MarR family transcriptional regulator
LVQQLESRTPTRALDLNVQWNRLSRLHATVEHALASALQNQHRLGLSEFRALQAIAGSADGELRLQEITEVLNLNQSSVSRLVGRLDAAGLTVRDICADDRRGVFSVVTPLGRERLAEALPTFESTLRSALNQALADPDLADLALSLGARPSG